MFDILKFLFKHWLSILFVIVFTVGGVFLGRYVLPFNAEDKVVVNSQSILQSVASQGFLVTHTIVSEQKATYTVDKGSDWSNFWWGHEVTARGTMQASLGLDLAPMTDQDIVVDQFAKTICFKYAVPTIHDTSLVGDLEVSSKSGILKKIFNDNANQDYNLALNLLRTESQKAALSVKNITVESYKNADRTLSFVLTKTNYSIVSNCRN